MPPLISARERLSGETTSVFSGDFAYSLAMAEMRSSWPLTSWMRSCRSRFSTASTRTGGHRRLFFDVKLSYERGCQEKNSPLLPYEGKLFALHPAQSCGLSAYFLSLTRAVSGYIPSVSCSDAGSTPSVREATQAGVLARGNMPTMILCPESGVKIAISALDRLQSVSFAQDAVGQIL